MLRNLIFGLGVVGIGFSTQASSPAAASMPTRAATTLECTTSPGKLTRLVDGTLVFERSMVRNSAFSETEILRSVDGRFKAIGKRGTKEISRFDAIKYYDFPSEDARVEKKPFYMPDSYYMNGIPVSKNEYQLGVLARQYRRVLPQYLEAKKLGIAHRFKPELDMINAEFDKLA